MTRTLCSTILAVSAILLAAPVASLAAEPQAAVRRPNIIFLLAGDLGRDGASCFGKEADIEIIPGSLSGAIGGAVIGLFAGLSGGLAVLIIGLLMPRRKCPECGFAFPKIGRKYARPGFGGGWICPKCECEVDRRGKKVR